MSCTVKQPIRAELNIEPQCEAANQSRAQHWAALWNRQSEQSSTLLFMTLPNKPITDHFILGRNPRVLKLFLENFCTYLSHILYQRKKLNIVSMHSMAPLKHFYTLNKLLVVFISVHIFNIKIFFFVIFHQNEITFLSADVIKATQANWSRLPKRQTAN